MADEKISALPATTTLDAADEFPLNDSGTTRKITAGNLAQQLSGFLPQPSDGGSGTGSGSGAGGATGATGSVGLDGLDGRPGATGASGAAGQPGVGAGVEIAAATVTSDVTVTSSTEASPTDVISLGAQAYDGTAVYIDFFSPAVFSTGTWGVLFELWDDTTLLERFADIRATSNQQNTFVRLSRRIVPSAGTHTYKVRAFKIGGSADVTVSAGAGGGGSGTYSPMLLAAHYANASIGAGAGWTNAGETWTYASADDPTYTLTITGDQSAKYSAGMRVRLSQATGGTKYFIITKVAVSTDTTLTLYGGTDYDLNNEAISSPYYSVSKAPQGFPLDPSKWTVSLTDTSSRSQSSAAVNTWYNLGSLSLDIPLGVWDVQYHVYADLSEANKLMVITLSTANNSESDSEFSARMYDGNHSSEIAQLFAVRKTVVLASKTTHYLNAEHTIAGTPNLSFLGNNIPTRVRAICAYL